MDKTNLFGKRFVFATIGIICITVASIWLKYDGATYAKLVLIIAGIFTAGQTWTDVKKNGNGKGGG